MKSPSSVIIDTTRQLTLHDRAFNYAIFLYYLKMINWFYVDCDSVSQSGIGNLLRAYLERYVKVEFLKKTFRNLFLKRTNDRKDLETFRLRMVKRFVG